MQKVFEYDGLIEEDHEVTLSGWSYRAEIRFRDRRMYCTCRKKKNQGNERGYGDVAGRREKLMLHGKEGTIL